MFAGIIVSFAFSWNYVDDDDGHSSKGQTSLQYITYSKTQSTEEIPGGSLPALTGKVNINTATKEELDALPGIGTKKAEAIIEYRNTVSTFYSIEDIMNVSGIGEGVFQQIKDHITVD